MKAELVPEHVFVEAKDAYRGEIINDDVAMRLERLAEELVRYARLQEQLQLDREAAYAF